MDPSLWVLFPKYRNRGFLRVPCGSFPRHFGFTPLTLWHGLFSKGCVSCWKQGRNSDLGLGVTILEKKGQIRSPHARRLEAADANRQHSVPRQPPLRRLERGKGSGTPVQRSRGGLLDCFKANHRRLSDSPGPRRTRWSARHRGALQKMGEFPSQNLSPQARFLPGSACPCEARFRQSPGLIPGIRRFDSGDPPV